MVTPRKGRTPEEVAQRKAAWAKVGRNVFPLWSNPGSATRPFRRWDDWGGDDSVAPASDILPALPLPPPPPGPESRFYVAPASDTALRRLLVVLCLSPAFLFFAVIAAVVTRQWGALAGGVALLLTYGVLKGVQIRAVAHELSKRRARRGNSDAP